MLISSRRRCSPSRTWTTTPNSAKTSASCVFPLASKLVGLTLSESRLEDAVDVQILCIVRATSRALIPTSDDRFADRERLMISAQRTSISILLMQGLEGMFIEAERPQRTCPC